MHAQTKHLNIYKTGLDAIGNTPIALFKNIHNTDCHIWAKLEFLSLGGSVKDRAAKRIIEQARTHPISSYWFLSGLGIIPSCANCCMRLSLNPKSLAMVDTG